MDHVQGITLLQKLAWTLSDAKHDYSRVEVAVFPPFTDLRGVQTLVQGDELDVAYGGQDLSQFDSGAYTGDISGQFLNKLGASTSWSGTANAAPSTTSLTTFSTPRSRPPTATASRRCCASAKAWKSARPAPTSSTPGPAPRRRRRAQRRAGRRTRGRLRARLGHRTGEVAGPEDAQEMCAAIRAELTELFGADVAAKVRLLYGGSVKANNAAAILNERDVDGVLVGGASLDPAEFANIVRFESHLVTD